MRAFISWTTIALFASLFSSPEPLAAKEVSGSTNLRLVIPEVCRLSAEQFILTENGRFAGQVQEFCNTNTEFFITATYRPLDAGEAASITYGDKTTTLDHSGNSKVATRTGQRLARIPVTIETQSLSRPLAVSFAITAL